MQNHEAQLTANHEHLRNGFYWIWEVVTAEAALSGQGNPTDHSLLVQSTSAIVLLLPKQVLEKSL